jgi:hypothetical protein
VIRNDADAGSSSTVIPTSSFNARDDKGHQASVATHETAVIGFRTSRLVSNTPVLIKGIAVHTSATDYRPIQQLKLRRFNGTRFELFGGVLSDD